jgi:high-affinity nickel-transport protein
VSHEEHQVDLMIDEFNGLHVGLAFTAFGFGLRHGIDWDHLAAIADVTSTQERPRRAMLLASLYAVGHGLVVIGLGVAAILTGRSIPSWLDAAMGRVVGLTLLVLTVVVLVSLVRDGREFRMRSRWMLVGQGISRAAGWTRTRYVEIVHDHPHDDGVHGHGHAHGHAHLQTPGPPDRAEAPRPVLLGVGHHHPHRHVAPVPADPFSAPGRLAAFLLGAVHGVGAETPTQVVLFLTAARVSGTAGAITLLGLFVAGIFVSNTFIAAGSSYGFLNARTSFRRYAVLAVVNAGFSAVVGAIFLAGGSLPAILGG